MRNSKVSRSLDFELCGSISVRKAEDSQELVETLKRELVETKGDETNVGEN